MVFFSFDFVVDKRMRNDCSPCMIHRGPCSETNGRAVLRCCSPEEEVEVPQRMQGAGSVLGRCPQDAARSFLSRTVVLIAR